MSASMHFGMALAQGTPDPSYANETADLHHPVLVGTTHALETTMPRLRPRERWNAPDGTAFGNSRWES